MLNMPLKIAINILLISLCFIPAFAQVAVQRNSNGEITNLSQVKFTPVVREVDFSDLNLDNRLNYSSIKGSPFWKDEWQQAKIYLENNDRFILPVKINLATGELHFLRNNEEFVSDDLKVMKVIFEKENDTAVFISHLPDLLFRNKKLDDFVQVLNSGDYQLLKYIKRNVASADSLVGTLKRYFFKDELNYFVRSNNKIDRIKKLNKENLLVLFPSKHLYSAWIDSHHINFKNEKDVISFLNYYNSLTH